MNNYTTIYSSRLEFYKNEDGAVSGAKSFYADFFSDKGKGLIKFLGEIHNEDLEF